MGLQWQRYGFSWRPWCHTLSERVSGRWIAHDTYFGWLWFQFRVTKMQMVNPFPEDDE